MTRVVSAGPHPETSQVVDSPVDGLVILTTVPTGAVRCAHVRSAVLNHEAWPRSVCFGGDLRAGITGDRSTGSLTTTPGAVVVVVAGIDVVDVVVLTGGRSTTVDVVVGATADDVVVAAVGRVVGGATDGRVVDVTGTTSLTMRAGCSHVVRVVAGGPVLTSNEGRSVAVPKLRTKTTGTSNTDAQRPAA